MELKINFVLILSIGILLTLLISSVSAGTYAHDLQLAKPRNISEAVLKLLKPRTTAMTLTDDISPKSEASEFKSVRKPYPNVAKRPTSIKDVVESESDYVDERPKNYERTKQSSVDDYDERDRKRENISQSQSSGSLKHGQDYEDEDSERKPRPTSNTRKRRPSSKTLEEPTDYTPEIEIKIRRPKKPKLKRKPVNYDDDDDRNEDEYQRRPLTDSDSTSLKDTEYDEEREEKPRKTVWVKGNTESRVVSQSDSPTISYEVFQKSPLRLFKGSRLLSKLRPRLKRPRPIRFRPSKTKIRRPRKKLPRRPFQTLRKLKFRKKPRRSRSRSRPPPSKSKVRKPRGGKTPPEVEEFCLMHSDRCSWSQRDKRLLLLDENHEELAGNYPHNDETPTELMKYCVSNSMHCHWSRKEKRWFLNEGIDKEDPEP